MAKMRVVNASLFFVDAVTRGVNGRVPAREEAVAQDGAGGDGEGDEAPEPQPREKVEKVSVVAVPHAVVYPWTVVVHLQHAPQLVGFIALRSILTI